MTFEIKLLSTILGASGLVGFRVCFRSLQESIGIEDAKMETVSFASVCQFVESGYAILFVCGNF